MDIFEAVQKTIDLASSSGRVYKLYCNNGEYTISSALNAGDDWILKVYPGGRRIMSPQGKYLYTQAIREKEREE